MSTRPPRLLAHVAYDSTRQLIGAGLILYMANGARHAVSSEAGKGVPENASLTVVRVGLKLAQRLGIKGGLEVTLADPALPPLLATDPTDPVRLRLVRGIRAISAVVGPVAYYVAAEGEHFEGERLARRALGLMPHQRREREAKAAFVTLKETATIGAVPLPRLYAILSAQGLRDGTTGQPTARAFAEDWALQGRGDRGEAFFRWHGPRIIELLVRDEGEAAFVARLGRQLLAAIEQAEAVDAAGQTAEADQVLRTAIANLPQHLVATIAQATLESLPGRLHGYVDWLESLR